jgi:hypothetical protein
LLKEGLGLSYTVTNDLDFFEKTDSAKINYSDKLIGNSLHIKPHTILFDHGIRDYHLEVKNNERFYKLFFKNNLSEIPFDFFGASFWLLTRYEEYLPFKGDNYNRFNYRSSLAYQYDFIQVPLVNIWLEELKKILLSHYPDLVFNTRQYSYLSTVDIDNAFKYKYKGFVRTLAGIISDRNFKKLVERFSIILGKRTDPFDCYNFLIETHKKLNIQAIYFLLLGDYGINDKNHSASDLRFQSLIKHLSDYSTVGIHPSFGSNQSIQQLKIEISRLGNITHRLITKSRQHFSMLTFPKTYQDLLQAGIYADYSMGYTNYNGFRASYCFPYKWYSLDIESISALTIHSFCISENTLLESIKNETLLQQSLPIINEVKKYKGEMISIFHNNNFNGELKKFYLEFIKAANS